MLTIDKLIIRMKDDEMHFKIPSLIIYAKLIVISEYCNAEYFT
jgi:hypothetical protein